MSGPGGPNAMELGGLRSQGTSLTHAWLDGAGNKAAPGGRNSGRYSLLEELRSAFL